MILIEDYVYVAVRDYLKENSQYNPIVDKKYPREPAKLNKQPRVIVMELENNYRSRTVDGIESCSNLMYAVDIYCVDGIDSTKEQISKELEKMVDYVMSRKLNMTRISCQKLPNLDTDILRIGMRYNCVINDYRGRIY